MTNSFQNTFSANQSQLPLKPIPTIRNPAHNTTIIRNTPSTNNLPAITTHNTHTIVHINNVRGISEDLATINGTIFMNNTKNQDNISHLNKIMSK
jgi:hypothetical protein